ncbi:hypothetical protein D3C86_2233600 [compost metagenome]
MAVKHIGKALTFITGVVGFRTGHGLFGKLVGMNRDENIRPQVIGEIGPVVQLHKGIVLPC